MAFLLLPAVDVAGGRAVRLVGGAVETLTAHGDALAAALAWQAAGAAWVHLVDLDAALGRGSNAELLAAMVRELEMKVEWSGGIHDEAGLVRALATGCDRVVLAMASFDDPTWCARAIAAHGGRIAVGLEVRITETADGSVRHRLVARGSTRDRGDLWETIAWLNGLGAARYVVTDVNRDGSLHGPNVELCRAVAFATDAAVVASGGVSSLDDLRALAGVAEDLSNLEGAIVGQALYTGRFTLSEALEAVAGTGDSGA